MITHAKSSWGRKRVADLVDLPSEDFRSYIPDYDFFLFDSIKEDPEAYDFAKSVQALLLIWKYFHSPEFIQMLQRAFRLMKQAYPDLKLRDFLEPIMKYLYNVRSEEEYIDIYKVAEEEFSKGDEYMGTIAEMFERKGEERKEQEFFQYKEKWVDEAKVENTQEMLITAFQNRFGIVKPKLAAKIRSIQSIESLNSLFNQIFFVQDENEFKELVDKVISEEE